MPLLLITLKVNGFFMTQILYLLEAAVAVRDYAFNVLEIPMLISIINHQNDASKRVAKKVGMKLMKQTNFKNVLVDVFCLKREEAN